MVASRFFVRPALRSRRHLCTILALGSALASPLRAEEAAGPPAPDAAPPAVSAAAPAPAAPAAPAPSKHLTVKTVWSQFADLPLAGDADDTLRYGGKIDIYAEIKGGAIGLDDSLSLQVRPEFRYGHSSNGAIGLLPVNTQLFYPASEGEKFDLSLSLTKRWKSGATLTVGKVDVLDLAAQLPVVGGGGHEGFMNLAMALPPSAIVPETITGALLTVPTRHVLYRLWVFDPQLQTRKSGFEHPFDKGVAFLGSVTFPVKVAGKPGFYAIKLAGSTRKEIAAEALPPVLVPAPGSGFGTGSGEFSVVLAAYQYLRLYADAPGKGWGVFGQVYLSNGDPTFLDRSAIFGISGNPHFRPQDRFGVAWFRYSLTDTLVRALKNRVPLRDEEGIEAFYTLGLTRKIRLTTDVQVVRSAIAVRATGVTGSLRLTTSF